MKKTLKEIVNDILLILVGVLVIVGGILIADYFKPKSNDFFGSKSTTDYPITVYGTLASPEKITATTTKIIAIGAGTDQVDFNVHATSSTNFVLNWAVAFSNADNCTSSTDPLVDWYTESTAGVTSGLVTWTPSTTNELAVVMQTGTNVTYKDLNSKCMRFIIGDDNMGGDNYIWSSVMLKQR